MVQEIFGQMGKNLVLNQYQFFSLFWKGFRGQLSKVMTIYGRCLSHICRETIIINWEWGDLKQKSIISFHSSDIKEPFDDFLQYYSYYPSVAAPQAVVTLQQPEGTT